MKNIITATDLKNRTAEILNDSYFKGKTILVGRYGKPIAKIVPIRDTTNNTIKFKKVLKTTFGILPDFPDITKARKSRRKSLKL